MTSHTHTNRLAYETSPYLLQHAHNPVDWYPWGPEAFEAAAAQNKPILLSVGYSACHWCHVMERESFENEAIAALMNRDFINIKVDREERPDVDAIYMTAVQMLTGQGGWPMTMFLTPQGKPFYGGTYYPPTDHYGRPGFPRVLAAVADSWKERPHEIEAMGRELLAQLDESNDLARHLSDSVLTPTVLEHAFDTLSGQFDRQYGGFGSSPKFPQPANLDFLLRFHARSKRAEPLAMVEKTLNRMALGGIYDQLGGGFHRYSVDQTWLVPHFEKMLYDNAQLAQTYIRCYQATGKSFYRGVAEEILEYVMREMMSSEGGFYSAQDADSEGEEGRFFVWTPAQVEAILGANEARVFGTFFDITQDGNWEGTNILRVVREAAQVAEEFGLSVEETASILDTGRAKLFAEREKRVKPHRDEKILTAWNGLVLAAFAEVAAVLDNDVFRQVAVKNAQFLLQTMTTTDVNGRLRLLRTYRNGQAKLNAYLEDYAFFAEGLLHLYEATFDPQWLTTARELTQSMFAYFWDDVNGGFFATSTDHETLIQRPKDWDDNATPSGNSVALDVLLRLTELTGDPNYRDHAARVLRRLGTTLEKHPYSFARCLSALDFYLSTPKEIAIIGDRNALGTQELLHGIYGLYLPNKVVVQTDDPKTASPEIPLLADRPFRNNKPTAYVCSNFVCKEPVTDAAALLAQLQP
jgi:uncharacterized protein YyaL (SSP411 family)